MTENTRVIQEIYAAFSRGDIPALLESFGDAAAFTIPGAAEIPMARTWRGRQGMLEFFTTLNQEAEFTEFAPREYIAEGDRVIVLGSYAGRVRRNGNEFRSEWVMAWRLRDGKVTEFREYNDTLALAESFGLVARAARA
jgi:ketosteroid isomerase-like protein